MAITSLRTTRDVARIWFYWKIPAIIAFCVIVFCICFYSFTSTPMYESVAKIIIFPKPNMESVVNPGQDQRQFLSRPVSNTDVNTEIELLKSKAVLERTIESYKHKKAGTSAGEKVSAEKEDSFWKRLTLTGVPLTETEKKVSALLGSLNIDPIITSNMITVSLVSPYQEQVPEVLGRLLENYLSYRKIAFSVGDTELFYEDQKNYYAQKLTDSIRKLKDFKEQWNILNMQSQTDSNLQLISDFQKELKTLEVQIAENQAKIDMVSNGLKIEGDQFIISREMRNLPIIVELAKGLVPLLIKRTEVSKTFTRQSREYKQIDDQILMLRQEIKNESRNAARTDSLENNTLMAKHNLLIKKLESLMKDSADFQRKKDEFEALELEVQVARQNFLKYGEKKEDSRLFAQRDERNLSNVTIAEAPSSPVRPKSPNKLLAFQVAIFLGLFAALVLPFILETLDHKVKTADDVEKILSVPVICSYPEV